MRWSELEGVRVFTNKPACGPKRGHGSVQPRFAFEVQLDQLAEKLALDPIAPAIERTRKRVVVSVARWGLNRTPEAAVTIVTPQSGG